MLVKVFSLNKFKSERLKRGFDGEEVKNPPAWALESDGHEVFGDEIRDTDCLSCSEWESYVDSKYVRR